jgi:hypothetical protein
MLVTLLGIVTEVKPEQLLNAFSPMLVTFSGIIIEVKEVHHLNALSPILVTGPSKVITPLPSLYSLLTIFAPKLPEVLIIVPFSLVYQISLSAGPM